MEKLYDYLMRFKNYLTPLKMLSATLIVMGLVDNLRNPIEHYPQENVEIEIVIRAIFIFCGFFGILGNGSTTNIRAFFVGLPYLWLAVLYAQAIITTNVEAAVLPFVITLILGLWTVFIGGHYDTGNTISIDYSRFNRIDTKPDNEVGRKNQA